MPRRSALGGVGCDPIDEQEAAREIRKDPIEGVADRMRVPIYREENLQAETQPKEENGHTRQRNGQIKPAMTFEPGVFHVE